MLTLGDLDSFSESWQQTTLLIMSSFPKPLSSDVSTSVASSPPGNRLNFW